MKRNDNAVAKDRTEKKRTEGRLKVRSKADKITL